MKNRFIKGERNIKDLRNKMAILNKFNIIDLLLNFFSALDDRSAISKIQ